jgi:hypothetical protein
MTKAFPREFHEEGVAVARRRISGVTSLGVASLALSAIGSLWIVSYWWAAASSFFGLAALSILGIVMSGLSIWMLFRVLRRETDKAMQVALALGLCLGHVSMIITAAGHDGAMSMNPWVVFGDQVFTFSIASPSMAVAWFASIASAALLPVFALATARIPGPAQESGT